MHKVMIRFKIVKSGEIIECLLDDRLDLERNLELLERICQKKLAGSLVYDPHKKVFLDRKIPLKDFHCVSYIMLYLFN